MISESGDPSGLVFFSRFARNRVCKFNNSSQVKNTITLVNSSRMVQEINNSQQQKKISIFDKQQSREQREKRFKQFNTPSVGRYNLIHKIKPKLVWDILSVHQKYEQIAQQRRKKTSSRINDQRSHKNLVTQSLFQMQNNLLKRNQNNNSKRIGNSLHMDHQLGIKDEDNIKSNSSVKKMGPFMDMSRMLGRKPSKSQQFNQESCQKINLNEKMNLIKKSIIKNIDFAKQLSRNQAYGQKYKEPSHDYIYDYRVNRPQNQKCLYKFDKFLGRELKQNSKRRLLPEYGYVHYQYDQYVWKNNSKIFKNTKTLVSNFNKQIDRKTN